MSSGARILVLVLVGSGSLWGQVAQSHPTRSTPLSQPAQHNQLLKYLTKYGYLPAPSDGNALDYTSLLPSAIQEFQDMARLPKTGELNEDTITMMSQPRCGVQDWTRSRWRRFLHSGSKWRKHSLTWKISSFPDHLSSSQVLVVFKDAFKTWANITNLYFEYRSAGVVDIEIKFLTGDHGDGYRFDGKGGVLAHAFYPPDPFTKTRLSFGDLHLDASETWTLNTNGDGENLYNTVLHEIGHSLGLKHSNAPGSVMWPWSADSAASQHTQAKLSSDDIIAVQSLYGEKTSNRYEKSENSHFLCRMHVDALLTTPNNKIYSFNGATVTELNSTTLEPVFGSQLISEVFPGFESDDSVDAAVSYKGFWPYEASYLFVGHQYYRYSLNTSDNQMTLDLGYPKNISLGWGFNESHFDSVYKYGGGNTPVFVKGLKYWMHTGTSHGPYWNYPKMLSMSPNLFLNSLAGIDAAFLHKNGTNYFLSDEHAYLLHHDDIMDTKNLQQLC